MTAWGPQPHQIGSLAIGQTGGASGPQLVAILRPKVTSWVAPKTSKYTIYAFGAGGVDAAGGLSRITAIIQKNASFTTAVATGSVFYNGSALINSSGNTTFSGNGIALVAGSNGAASSGGDVNVVGTQSASGSDGSVFAPTSPTTTVTELATHPGGYSDKSRFGPAVSASGEIRIVDETP